MASLPGLSSSWGYLNGVNPRLVTTCWQSRVWLRELPKILSLVRWHSKVRDTGASHKNITAYQRYTNLFAPQPSPALKPVLKNQYCACAVISIKCGMCQVSAGWRSCAIIADICGWYLINILVPSRLTHFWVRVQKFLYDAVSASVIIWVPRC